MPPHTHPRSPAPLVMLSPEDDDGMIMRRPVTAPHALRRSLDLRQAGRPSSATGMQRPASAREPATFRYSADVVREHSPPPPPPPRRRSLMLRRAARRATSPRGARNAFLSVFGVRRPAPSEPATKSAPPDTATAKVPSRDASSPPRAVALACMTRHAPPATAECSSSSTLRLDGRARPTVPWDAARRDTTSSAPSPGAPPATTPQALKSLKSCSDAMPPAVVPPAAAPPEPAPGAPPPRARVSLNASVAKKRAQQKPPFPLPNSQALDLASLMPRPLPFPRLIFADFSSNESGSPRPSVDEPVGITPFDTYAQQPATDTETCAFAAAVRYFANVAATLPPELTAAATARPPVERSDGVAPASSSYAPTTKGTVPVSYRTAPQITASVFNRTTPQSATAPARATLSLEDDFSELDAASSVPLQPAMGSGRTPQPSATGMDETASPLSPSPSDEVLEITPFDCAIPAYKRPASPPAYVPFRSSSGSEPDPSLNVPYQDRVTSPLSPSPSDESMEITALDSRSKPSFLSAAASPFPGSVRRRESLGTPALPRVSSVDSSQYAPPPLSHLDDSSSAEPVVQSRWSISGIPRAPLLRWRTSGLFPRVGEASTVAEKKEGPARVLSDLPAAEAMLPAAHSVRQAEMREMNERSASDGMSQVSPDSDDSSEYAKAGRVVDGAVSKLARFYGMLDNRGVRRAHMCGDLDLYASARDVPGWECGYLNAASLCSNLLLDDVSGRALRRAGMFDAPGVDAVAARIEKAWKAGYDSTGGERYGGTLRGRRAYIGVVEVAVLLVAAAVRTRVRAFDTHTPRGRREMYDWIYAHFERACSQTRGGCALHPPVARASAAHVPAVVVAPIMLQWPGHSVLVVGAERMRGGEARLFVLDPVRPAVDAFTDRGVRSRVASVRRGENHPSLAADRFQLVYVDPEPAAHYRARASVDAAAASPEGGARARAANRLSGKLHRRMSLDAFAPAFSWRRAQRTEHA